MGRIRKSRIPGLALSVALACALVAPHAARADGAGPVQPYRSPMRDQCEVELQKDKGWQAELRQSVRPDVHQEDAAIMAKNKKHVVMAYGALWGLTVVFLVLLWLRQRRLMAELDQLSKQIEKAAAE